MDRDFPLYAIELSRLRDFSGQRRPQHSIHFRLESDSIPIRSSPVDLWMPEFRQYAPSPEGNVQHLDETSTWRGLSISQAREIKFWEDMFAAVLEYKISNHLIDIIDAMAIDECGAVQKRDLLSHHICESVNNVGCRTYPVNIREIIMSMIELHKRHGSQHQWLASSGDFHNGLCEFLRTRDCFLDTPLQPTVKVAFSASMNAQDEPTVCGRVKRYGPIVRFTCLDNQAFLDRSCHIHPSFVNPILDPDYDVYLAPPEYQLKSDCIAFEWYDLQQGFVGFLKSGDVKPSKQPTPKVLDMTATGTRVFPEEVRFERTIRLKIDITVHQEHKSTGNLPLSGLPSYESLQVSPCERISSDLLRDSQRHHLSPAFPIDDLSLRMKKRGDVFGHNPKLPFMENDTLQQFFGLGARAGQSNSEPSSTRVSTGKSLERQSPLRPEAVPNISTWWQVSANRYAENASSWRNPPSASLISHADDTESRAQSNPYPATQLSSSDPAAIRGDVFGANAHCQTLNSPSALEASGPLFKQNVVEPFVNDSLNHFPGHWNPENERDFNWRQQLSKWQKHLDQIPAIRRASSESRVKTLPIRSSNIDFKSSQDSSNATVCYSGSSKNPPQKEAGRDRNQKSVLAGVRIGADNEKWTKQANNMKLFMESTGQSSNNSSDLERPWDANARGRRRSHSCGPSSSGGKRPKPDHSSDKKDISSVNPGPIVLELHRALEFHRWNKAREAGTSGSSRSSGKNKNHRNKGKTEKTMLVRQQHRRHDSAITESSQTTAIKTQEKSADEMQAEMREFYDTMVLKHQVEQNIGRRRLRAGEKSDEEAFEEAFRGEDYPGINTEDFDYAEE